MDRYSILLMMLITFLSIPQIYGEESNSVVEFVIFKVKDPSKGIEIARSIIKDAKEFNHGVIEDKVYQSVNDPSIIAQCITWKSLDKAKEALAAFDTFPSASNFSNQSESVLFFDHFKQITD